MVKKVNLHKYRKYYKEERLTRKLASLAGKVSSKLLYYVLLLLLLMSDKSIPKKVRLVFMAALGYFILPSDLVADIIPGLGFSDDIAFLTYAISNAAQYITPEIEEKAKEKLDALLNRQNGTD